MGNKKRRKSLAYMLPKIIERDGGKWECHYCGIGLIPPGSPEDAEPYYKLVMTEVVPLYGWGYFNLVLDDEWESKAEAWHRGDLIIYDVKMRQSEDYRLPAVDHVVPYSHGGSDDISNLVATCRECNQKKLNHSYEWFMEQIRKGTSNE